VRSTQDVHGEFTVDEQHDGGENDVTGEEEQREL
jgi:hypothetical protein